VVGDNTGRSANTAYSLDSREGDKVKGLGLVFAMIWAYLSIGIYAICFLVIFAVMRIK